MKEGPLVSILMTSFNREKYIAEAIESVLASWYQSWELIIVDDCSRDRTVEIANSYEAKDPRIKVYINEQNLGDYPNRNRAASYAKGKYLKYLDADDLIYSHGLGVMVESIEKFPEAGCALAFPSSDFIVFPCLIEPREIFKENFFKESFFFNSPLGAIIKKEVFIKVGGFLEEKHVGDEDLWMKIAMEFPIVKMVKGTAHWRNHALQESKLGKKNIDVICRRYFIPLQYLKNTKCPLNIEERRKAFIYYKYKFIRSSIFSQNFIKLKIRKGLILIYKCQINIKDILISLLPKRLFKCIFLKNIKI